jgi:hypothetical protein
MNFAATKLLFCWSCLCLVASAPVRAECPVGTVIVKGRVEHVARNATVRVQLVYSKDEHQESAEATLDRDRFSIPVEFLTQSRKPVLLGTLREKCDRRPTEVIVTLSAGDQRFDQLSLDLTREFKKVDVNTYAARSEVVLHGAQP